MSLLDYVAHMQPSPRPAQEEGGGREGGEGAAQHDDRLYVFEKRNFLRTTGLDKHWR